MMGPDTRSGGRQAGRPGQSVVPAAEPPGDLAWRPVARNAGATGQSAGQGSKTGSGTTGSSTTGSSTTGSSIRTRRGSLSNWPVATRLGAVFALASVLGLVFGGVRIAEAVGTANADARTTQLAVFGQQGIVLAQALEDERDLTAGVAAYSEMNADALGDRAGPAVRDSISGAQARAVARLTAAERVTDAAARRTRALASAVGPAFPVSVQATAQDVIAMIDSIHGLRDQLTSQSAVQVVTYYSESVSVIFSLEEEIAGGSGDAALANDTRALGAISRSKDQASQQRAILYSTLIELAADNAGSARPFSNITGKQALTDSGGLGAFTTAQGLQFAYAADFSNAATPAQNAAYQAIISSGPDETMQLLSGFVSLVGDPRLIFEKVGNRVPLEFNRATVAATWYNTSSAVIGQLHVVEQQLTDAIVDRSKALEHDAIETAIVTSIVTVAAVLLVLLATALVARSLVRPLRRLQADALEIAAVRLPAQVAAAAGGTDQGDRPATVEPIGVSSTDEIGRVARAFDQVHAEALRLAGNEAQLRGSLNAMFISLSRRSVPLIDKLARMIDSLEQNEDDPDQLADLFSMDHLVTRMRRNSENLLVLAGEEQVRKWGEPVPLTDVARAAAAEIEQYQRVALIVQPGLLISGQAAADVVHLLAELIENATLFSPRDTQVRVTATTMDSGGVMVEVRDGGVGISDARLAEMNFRLDHPPVIDVSVSRHMGLYAVSRLAARHGIRVRLRSGTSSGVSALVWLPDALAPPQQSPVQGMPSRSRGPENGLDPVGAGRGGIGTAGSDSGLWASAGRHRSGQLSATGDQPQLGTHARRPAVGPAGPVGPVGPERNLGRGAGVPAGSVGSGSVGSGGGQAAQPETAWFRAKRPSGGRAAPSEAELTVGWREPPGWNGGARDSARPEETRQTKAGLPVRVPRPDLPARAPGSDLPARTPGSGLPARMPRSAAHPGNDSAASSQPGTGAQSGDFPAVRTQTAGAPLLGAPTEGQRRRTPDAVRSRTTGFQLGSRDAVDTSSTQDWTSPQGEETDR